MEGNSPPAVVNLCG